MRCKGSETLIGTVCMSLFANMVQCAPPSDLSFTFFYVSCLSQTLMLEMLLFLSHYRIPVLWLMNDIAVRALLKGFTFISVGYMETSILQCVMANHILCSCVVWLCLWCGPRVCNKWIVIIQAFHLWQCCFCLTCILCCDTEMVMLSIGIQRYVSTIVKI